VLGMTNEFETEFVFDCKGVGTSTIVYVFSSLSSRIEALEREIEMEYSEETF